MPPNGTGLAAALADVVDELDIGSPEQTKRPPTYIAALTVGQLFADPRYQRPLDDYRVQRMTDAFDVSLVGIVDVSKRDSDLFAIIDGQHRWAVLREIHGEAGPIVCNVHQGLTVEQEASLFYEIDRSRRNLTGWDRWWARRGSGEQGVLDIERTVEKHGLAINPTTKDGVVRATKACEDVAALGGQTLLDSTFSLLLAAWGRAADALDGAHIHGLALVIHHYDVGTELDADRLVAAMQDIAPRQVKARAAQLREAHKGVLPRLVAAVLVDRYNAQPGRKVEDFFVRLPTQGKTAVKRGAKQRQDDAIRSWARREGLMTEGESHRIPKRVREAYDTAHPTDQEAAPYDEVAVQRAVEGWGSSLPRSERLEALRRLHAQGLSDSQIADRVKVTPRQVLRDRQTLNLPSNFPEMAPRARTSA
jgi:hypothetical protein